MARFKITGPDGNAYHVNAPDGASMDDVLADAQKQFSGGAAPAEAEQYGPERPQIGQGEAGARGAGQGLSLGFGDEIYGAVKGAYDAATTDKTFSDAYRENRDASRFLNETAQQQNPGTYLAGELAGGIAVPGGLARTGATKAVSAATSKVAPRLVEGRIANSAAQGAAYGGAAGAGHSTAEDVAGVLEDVGMGAMMGAGIGAVAPPVIDAAAAVGRRVTAPLRAYMDPKGAAAGKVAEAVGRDFGRSGTPDALEEGAQKLAERAARNADDPQLMTVDLAGENTRRLARAASNMPNDNVERFNTVLRRRQVTAPNRMADDIEETLAPGGDFYKSVDDLLEQRGKEAGPAFRQSYNEPFNVTKDDDLAKFLNERGYMRRLVAKTRETIEGMTGKTPGGVLDDVGKRPAAAPTERELSDIAQIRANIGPLEHGQAESILDMHRYVNSMRRQSNPESLIEFLRSRGGLQNQGDELRYIMGEARQRPGLMSQRGMTLDDAAEAAQQAGFFTNRPTVAEFLESLRDDLHGARRVRINAGDDADNLRVAGEMSDELTRMGIDPKMSESTLRQALGVPEAVAKQVGSAKPTMNQWEFMHRVRMEIGREMQRLKRGEQDKSANWTLSDLRKLRDELDGHVGQHNAKLGAAIKRYSDQSDMADAAREGLDELFKLAPEELAAKVAKMTKPEADMYRLGQARALIDKVRSGRASTDRVERDFSSPDMQQRLKVVFPDGEQRGKFLRRLNQERMKARTNNEVTKGSQTDRRQVTQAETANPAQALEVARMGVGAVSGKLEPLLSFAGRVGNWATGLNPRTANHVLDLMMQKGAGGLDESVRAALAKAKTAAERRAVLAQMITETGAIQAGAAQ